MNNAIVTVFQFEIRYSHILNFSQISRKILSPYVHLADSINIEKQNTFEERIILNFEKEDYLIIVNWDRILIKGQGSMKAFVSENSPIQIPFFAILEQIKSLDEFGSIKNILLAINFVKKLDYTKDGLVNNFMNKTIIDSTSQILKNTTDIAITLESKIPGDETSISYGPYFGSKELLRRPMIPINIGSLNEIEFLGAMVEYKYFKTCSDIKSYDFKDFVTQAEQTVNSIWKTL